MTEDQSTTPHSPADADAAAGEDRGEPLGWHVRFTYGGVLHQSFHRDFGEAKEVATRHILNCASGVSVRLNDGPAEAGEPTQDAAMTGNEMIEKWRALQKAGVSVDGGDLGENGAVYFTVHFIYEGEDPDPLAAFEKAYAAYRRAQEEEPKP